MERISNFMGSKANSDPMSLSGILRAVYTGTATDEQKQYYIEHYMSAGEKKIGKPLFDMTQEEEKQFNAYMYNNKKGDLTGYDCPKCKNKGHILVVEDGHEIMHQCSCWTIRKTIRKMEECGLGSLLTLYTFDRYECKEDWQRDAYNKAKAFVTSDKHWFCMLGESGSGKSHLCTAISRELLKNGYELKYMVWMDESTILKQAKANNPDRYEAMINEIKEMQVLYIDDFLKVGKNEEPTTADINLAMEILNYRYNMARIDQAKRYVTIISSERTLEQLFEYDAALGGRIVEMTKPYNLIMLSGAEKNYRLK